VTVAAPAPIALKRRRRLLTRARTVTLESVLLFAAMLGIAVAARWPNLWLIPTFTDETIEVRLAYDVARGLAAPLTNVDPYIGAFWTWVLALGFWVFGMSPWLPRLLSFFCGVLTVAAAWWLGKQLAGRTGAVVAALFMAGCSTHVLVNSHVAWSHATTPLWTTLGFACLVRALRGDITRRARWLVGAGFFLGLGVQTHITAVLLLPGAALALLLQRPALLRTRWAVFGILAFLLAISNLIVFNIQTGGATFTGGQAVLADYTGQDEGVDAGSYGENVGRLTLATGWVLSGAIEKRRFVGETLLQPLVLGYLGLAVGSVAWAARRGFLVPLLVTVPYLLVLPVLQGKYEPLLNGRYVMPILPLVFASIGLAAADALTLLRRRLGGRALLPSAVFLGLVALAAVYPLAGLAHYQRTARTNHAIIAAYDAVMADRQPDDVVLVDYGLDGVFFMAAGSAFKSTELLLGGSSVPYTVIDARASSLANALSGQDSRLLVLNTEKVRVLSRNFTLTPLMGGERDGPGFGVFRVSARP
jgi:4-amino-4-deoxy-L-arabinose transferase-like glycosyltransferase